MHMQGLPYFTRFISVQFWSWNTELGSKPGLLLRIQLPSLRLQTGSSPREGAG